MLIAELSYSDLSVKEHVLSFEFCVTHHQFSSSLSTCGDVCHQLFGCLESIEHSIIILLCLFELLLKSLDLVSHGSVIVEDLLIIRNYNIQKLIDFSGIVTSLVAAEFFLINVNRHYHSVSTLPFRLYAQPLAIIVPFRNICRIPTLMPGLISTDWN